MSAICTGTFKKLKPIGKVQHNSRIESSLSCKKGALRVVLRTKFFILLAKTGLRKINSAACGFSPIKIHFSDYPKSLISRITEAYVLSIKYRYWDILLKKH